MKTINDFKEFYSSILVNELNPLESVRKKILNYSISLLFLLLVTAVFAYTDLLGIVAINNAFITTLSIISLCCVFFLYNFINKSYIQTFKFTIISRIINFIDPTFTYESNSFINLNHLINSGLLEITPNIYTGDDYVSGSIGETSIEFSEIHIAQKYEKETYEIFKGFFLIANFNKHFDGRTLVLPDRHEKYLGHFASAIQSMETRNGQLITLEDPEFEKNFVVYGDNQITSRYILTTSLMKRINDFKSKTGGDIVLSFVNSFMYMAVPVGKNLFQPSFFGSILDYQKIEFYYLVLNLFIGIVEDFDLNTRSTY